MEKYIFREQLDRNRLKRRLGRIMDFHLLVNIEKLGIESGLPPTLVRSLVEEMVQHEEAERLRPMNYEKDDKDFFRLCRPRLATDGILGHQRRRNSWDRWIGTVKRAVRVPILGRRQNVY